MMVDEHVLHCANKGAFEVDPFQDDLVEGLELFRSDLDADPETILSALPDNPLLR